MTVSLKPLAISASTLVTCWAYLAVTMIHIFCRGCNVSVEELEEHGLDDLLDDLSEQRRDFQQHMLVTRYMNHEDGTWDVRNGIVFRHNGIAYQPPREWQS